MILLALLMVQTDSDANTKQEIAFCASKENIQPYRFCLVDQRYERARKELAVALIDARRAAIAKRREIAESRRLGIGVTLSGDPVRALQLSQRAWERSYRADCYVVGLGVATGNAGTQGVTTDWECEMHRVLDRVAFLKKAF
ncbi:lysozyme inhibitor LprI family protein [Sphingomonas sp. 7/4-4]|uniref:lysozyme inhibitor LprI family protein n=1 Tax=Sphingomonas sp. 7/4-4 TaxID=3018446 RepID=UPI0022F398B7|nr:lysozyme inhibitor LprI family protein [Sphingomonas sp. 7/4-4]WBY08407.1 lysozyme inhibitor LprI family protein [Sphingomonas sp. 7/4-4]